ncbi:MAG TPA: hypothetical protein VKR30_03710 [Candidatus Limnocylindrales bacterium]|nr:hypothetical protein [Candidatus Limnocylindrales bacterium]
MTFLGRDSGEIDALVTDRYLDSLLAGRANPGDPHPLDEAVRLVSRRLAGDLPRFHPSFRFEERLALRLAEAAASMRLPLAAGAERSAAAIPSPLRRLDADPLEAPLDEDDDRPDRAMLVGSAVAASLSLAGAAWLAWRRRGSPMARAARAAHSRARA